MSVARENVIRRHVEHRRYRCSFVSGITHREIAEPTTHRLGRLLHGLREVDSILPNGIHFVAQGIEGYLRFSSPEPPALTNSTAPPPGNYFRPLAIAATVEVPSKFISLSSVSKSLPSFDCIAKKTVAPLGPPCSM